MSLADSVVIFVLALLLFGPKKLPVIARQIGKALNEFRRASNEFKAQIESEINQLEWDERRKKELEQNVMKPAEPPAGAVPASASVAATESAAESPGADPASPSAAPTEAAAAEPTPPSPGVDSPAHDITHA